MKQSMVKWAVIDNLMITFATAGPVADDVYELILKDLKTKPVTKYLAASVGTLELSSVQRKQLSDIFKSRGISIAAVTDERLVRGVIVALGWLGADIKAYAWSELREAIRHLQASPSTEARALDAVLKFKAIHDSTR